jgi:hypothetical protein
MLYLRRFIYLIASAESGVMLLMLFGTLRSIQVNRLNKQLGKILLKAGKSGCYGEPVPEFISGF